MDQGYKDSNFISSDYRANFKNVIAKRSDLLKFMAGRTINAAPGAILTMEAGTLMGLATSGADAGYYKPYLAAAVDGSQIPVGFLSEQVTTDEFYNGSKCTVIISGELFSDLLIGVDAGAITALHAKVLPEAGNNIFIF